MAAMAESSRRAARRSDRGGLPNTLFVVAAAELPPDELVGLADELTITFPWGSLLAGALAVDAAAAAGIAALVAAGGRVRILASVVAGDGLAIRPLAADDVAAIAARWSCLGLGLTSFRPATTPEVDASASSWARRLAAGRRRPTWRIDLVKDRAAGAPEVPSGIGVPASTPAADEPGRAR